MAHHGAVWQSPLPLPSVLLLNNANTDELHPQQRAQDKGGKEREYDGAARALRSNFAVARASRRTCSGLDDVGSGPAAREKESPQMRRRGGQIQISHWALPLLGFSDP